MAATCAAIDPPSLPAPRELTAVTRSPPRAVRQCGRCESRPLPTSHRDECVAPPNADSIPPGRCRKAARPPPASKASPMRLPATSQLAASLQGPYGIDKAGQSFCQSRSPSSTTMLSPWQSLAHSWASQRPQSARLFRGADGGASSPTRPATGRAGPLPSARPSSGHVSKQQPSPYGGVWPHGDALTVRSPALRGTSPGLKLVAAAYAPSVRADHALSPPRPTSAALQPSVHSPRVPRVRVRVASLPRPASAAAEPPVHSPHTPLALSPRRPTSAAPEPPVHSPRAPPVVPHVSDLLLGWRYPGEAAPGQLRGHSPRRSFRALLRQTALLSGCADSGLWACGGGTGLPARQPAGPPVMESSTATIHQHPAYQPRVPPTPGCSSVCAGVAVGDG